ncbi:DUF2946 family protein [Uliginosibacterium sp. 31-12]|uniref:DUF2946 family protein n=1 Tax=Uliginosibacterium sp. 31-12 TaxID=3062781 RepID=UPI0026E31CF7|nr:DUF2946 family protein [Uliginosibacterium sp. 31-12]MDO6385841.1 DUF2946 family protein [Uliginosibacterium sp. 31-12]
MSRRPFIPQRNIVWMALLAILLHAALPFVHGLLQTPARGFYTSLCAVGSPQQTMWVALDEQTQPVQEKEQAQMLRCPLCMAGAHLALNPPAYFTLALRSDLFQPRPLAAAQLHLPGSATAAYHSRAPPAFSA